MKRIACRSTTSARSIENKRKVTIKTLSSTTYLSPALVLLVSAIVSGGREVSVLVGGLSTVVQRGPCAQSRSASSEFSASSAPRLVFAISFD